MWHSYTVSNDDQVLWRNISSLGCSNIKKKNNKDNNNRLINECWCFASHWFYTSFSPLKCHYMWDPNLVITVPADEQQAPCSHYRICLWLRAPLVLCAISRYDNDYCTLRWKKFPFEVSLAIAECSFFSPEDVIHHGQWDLTKSHSTLSVQRKINSLWCPGCRGVGPWGQVLGSISGGRWISPSICEEGGSWRGWAHGGGGGLWWLPEWGGGDRAHQETEVQKKGEKHHETQWEPWTNRWDKMSVASVKTSIFLVK